MRLGPHAFALVLALVLALALPSAQAALCLGGACAADEPYRDASEACDGTRWVTGAWFSTPEVYVYALGERHDCPGGWGGVGGHGLRVGVYVAGADAEFRWYDHAGGSCDAGVFGMGFHAGGPCVAPPPAIPWGNALP